MLRFKVFNSLPASVSVTLRLLLLELLLVSLSLESLLVSQVQEVPWPEVTMS
jgi:hypothetical protein